MKTQIFVVVTTTMFSLLAMGSRGCDVWADVDNLIYEANTQGLTTLTNESSQDVFLPGCAQFTLEQWVAGSWINRGPNVQCFWEGIGAQIVPGNVYDGSFSVPSELGTYRIDYLVSWGCEEGKPLSQANCEGQDHVYSPQFEVIAQSEDLCFDVAEIDFGRCEMLMGWAIKQGTCQPISGCGDQGFSFFGTKLECLSACENDCNDWTAAKSNLLDQAAQCEYASDCEAVIGTSCGCTRNVVVNRSNVAAVQEFYQAMSENGCSLMTTCDCPAADGFVCTDGMCAWNYR